MQTWSNQSAALLLEPTTLLPECTAHTLTYSKQTESGGNYVLRWNWSNVPGCLEATPADLSLRTPVERFILMLIFRAGLAE